MLSEMEGTTMPRPEWRDPAKEKRWRRLLDLWGRSGQTGKQFCAAHGLSKPSFYFWKREIARRDHEARTKAATRESPPRHSAAAALPAFVPVTIDAAASSAALEIVTAHGRVVRVRAGFDADALRRLLTVLEEPSC
jgi:transposase